MLSVIFNLVDVTLQPEISIPALSSSRLCFAWTRGVPRRILLLELVGPAPPPAAAAPAAPAAPVAPAAPAAPATVRSVLIVRTGLFMTNTTTATVRAILTRVHNGVPIFDAIHKGIDFFKDVVEFGNRNQPIVLHVVRFTALFQPYQILRQDGKGRNVWFPVGFFPLPAVRLVLVFVGHQMFHVVVLHFLHGTNDRHAVADNVHAWTGKRGHDHQRRLVIAQRHAFVGHVHPKRNRGGTFPGRAGFVEQQHRAHPTDTVVEMLNDVIDRGAVGFFVEFGTFVEFLTSEISSRYVGDFMKSHDGQIHGDLFRGVLVQV